MKTILVLEDDPGNMQVFCALLGSKGFRVREATTGQEAIEISSNELGSIDLLVSDLRLPDLASTEVALRLIESRPNLPILFLSGIPMLNWTKRDLLNLTCLAASAVDFLEKPFHVSTFETKIENLLDGHSHIHSLQGVS